MERLKNRRERERRRERKQVGQSRLLFRFPKEKQPEPQKAKAFRENEESPVWSNEKRVKNKLRKCFSSERSAWRMSGGGSDTSSRGRCVWVLDRCTAGFFSAVKGEFISHLKHFLPIKTMKEGWTSELHMEDVFWGMLLLQKQLCYTSLKVLWFG